MSELPPIEPGPTAPAPLPGLPWEEPSAGLGSIFPTAGKILGQPIAAYSTMSLDVDLVRPIAYFVLWILIGACIGQLWSYLLFDSLIGMVRSLAGSEFERIAPLMHRPGGLQLVLSLIVTPLIALIGLFIWTGLVHLTLSLLGGAGRGFAASLRVVCYAETTQICAIVPGLGGLVGLVWRLILDGIGLTIVHKTEPWKAALSIIIPIVLCCACIAAGSALVGTAVLQAIQNMK